MAALRTRTLSPILAIVAAAGCSTYSDLPLEAPQPALRIVSLTPANGSVIPGAALVRARLHYRLDNVPGEITVMVLCAKGGQPACLDAGKLADLTDREGDVDVAFAVRGPTGVTISVTLRLGAAQGPQPPRGAVGLTYRTEG